MGYRGVLVLILSLFCLATSVLTASPSDYLITSLPGYEGPWPTFKQYSGYITVNETHGRYLFFYFVESQNNPASDPVVLWLQGGPGCSGLYAVTQEHGPITSNSDLKGGMRPFGWSWNRVANMLYIESPAGVGFSYSKTPSDYNTGDNRTAEDNYVFLQRWYQVFTQFRTNDLWIVGESYGGVYVPTLTLRVLDGPDSHLRSVLKGLMLGNPVVDCSEFGIIVNPDPLQVELYFWHGMVSFADYTAFHDAGCDRQKPPNQQRCDDIFTDISNAIGNIDGDDLYTNPCTGNGTLDLLATVPGCVTSDEISTRWFNRADVQAALHARPTVWADCTNAVNYTTENPSMLSYMRYFFAKRPDLKILFYSGDVDIATVPHAFTQFCLSRLRRPIIQKWRPYYLPGIGAPGGYVEVFDRYTYATIKGAGHEAPAYQPALAYHMFSNFLKTGRIP
jgi:serine carboxypeptidase-like clade 2